MEVWKFEIPIDGFKVEIPQGAVPLSVGIQGNAIMVWATVDPSAPKVTRAFPIYGTGHKIPPEDRDLPFIGTVFIGPYVFHVFDRGES